MIHVSLDHSAKPVPNSRYAGMEMPTEVLMDFVEFGSQALGNGLAADGEAFSIPGSTTVMSEPIYSQLLAGFDRRLPAILGEPLRGTRSQPPRPFALSQQY
jgi:hypothetical protein